MPISFTCPHCGRFTEVSDQYAGQSGPCAGCGRTITIPGKLGPAPLKPVSAPVPRRPAPSNTSTVVILAVVLGVVGICGVGGLAALLLPAIQSAREAARRMTCSNQLKQIGLAMHNYHDTYRCFPAGYVADENGRPMHSWRVAILPFIECQYLYDQYNFDEPWDSFNNMRVARQMPEIFRCPTAPDTGDSNLTHYVVVLGDSPPGEKPDSMFGANRWTRMSEVVDGTSNTLLVVEVKEPVPWTQPDNDLRLSKMNFQINQGSQSIGSFHRGGANVLFADGSVHFLPNETNPADLRLLVQPADGKAVRFGY